MATAYVPRIGRRVGDLRDRERASTECIGNWMRIT